MFRRYAFADPQQLARVCRTLCDLASLDGCWTAEYGPTDKARRLLSDNLLGLSAGQKVSFRVAWLLWDGTAAGLAGPLTLEEILQVLSGEWLKPVGDLISALADGPNAVARWLRMYDRVART